MSENKQSLTQATPIPKSKLLSKPKKASFRRRVIRWHRRIGITSALVVVLLSVTGIALNHISSLTKSEPFVSTPFVSTQWLLDWYHIDAPVVVDGYQLQLKQQTEPFSDVIWADGTIFVHQRPVLFNQQAMLGVKVYQNILYIFTRSQIHLFTFEGQRIESSALSLSISVIAPTRIYPQFDQAFNLHDSRLVALQLDQAMHVFDLEKMEFIDKTDNVTLGDQLNNSKLTSDLDATLARRFILLKSKVLLDLHSGRFFGRFGSLLMDIFAIAFLLLALTGTFVWIKNKK